MQFDCGQADMVEGVTKFGRAYSECMNKQRPEKKRKLNPFEINHNGVAPFDAGIPNYTSSD